ncbi:MULTISPECIES: FAD-binding oxidoreductase [Haloferax]|uniref:FAD-binding protein n=2 Tax=Haloferax TaxID=2251 RepID=A0A6G1Z434_9EURY|nr:MULTISPECIES: FAD-binding oxidoreductase [Haloferax]KAB1188617.1 FAD-binding oxidoreductase [Haloferax sp. CBA1149]MRW81319.1 FAD-binding protein [Haloferax marinisediminis]
MATASTPIDDSIVSELETQFRGTLLQPTEAGYDEARNIWNAMIDRRPALIAQCAGVADVRAAVDFARTNDLLVSVKGAGHNIAGNAINDDGLVIDLSPMKSVRVDPEAKTARVEPGVILSELDHETQAFGLATPVGYNSTTGISGLTLGGGFGWLSRKYGLTADNLRSVDIVTADGELRHASESENEDLFWAVRGGSGNFGIVTSFEFDLHAVGPEVLSGLIVHPFDDAADVLRAYREYVATVPDDVTAWMVFRHAPPLEFIPEEWHGKMVLILAAFYAGSMSDGEEALKPLREIGSPIVDVIGPHPYEGWQQAFDGLLGPGARNYWKSHNFEEITDGMIDTFVEYAASMPTPLSEIAVAQLGGAINHVSVEETAYPHRDAEFLMNLHTRWEDPAQDDECIAWARECYEAMKPHATGGVYVNFIPEDVGEERAAYRENYDRLVEIKKTYDPENLFRMNQNVTPTS